MVLKPEPERQGFYRPQSGPADVSVSEKHDNLTTLEKHFEKFIFVLL